MVHVCDYGSSNNITKSLRLVFPLLVVEHFYKYIRKNYIHVHIYES